MGRSVGPWLENFKPLPKDNSRPQQALMVSQLIDETRGEWDLAKLKDTFDEASICAIVKIPLSMRNKLLELCFPISYF